jgi:hypothetical protein
VRAGVARTDSEPEDGASLFVQPMSIKKPIKWSPFRHTSIEDMPICGALQARVSGATPGEGVSGFGCARVMVYNALSKLPNQTEASQVGPL